jgi:hypothetical protein
MAPIPMLLRVRIFIILKHTKSSIKFGILIERHVNYIILRYLLRRRAINPYGQ